MIDRLRARANRHRAVALTLTSAEDARAALLEADLAERTANQLDAEMAGNLLSRIGLAPLYEQI